MTFIQPICLRSMTQTSLLLILRCLTLDRYERYSQKKGWKFEVVYITETDLRGFKVCLNLKIYAHIDILIIQKISITFTGHWNLDKLN